MIEHHNTLIILTARMAAHGLPGLPMVDVAGQPLVLRARQRAVSANLGHVLVATPDMPVAEFVRASGADAMIARPQHPSPVCIAAEALSLRDPEGRFTHVVLLDVASATNFDDLTLRRSLAGLTNETIDVVATAHFEKCATLRAVSALGPDREVAMLRGIETGAGEAAGWQILPVQSIRRQALESLAKAISTQVPPQHVLSIAMGAGLRVAVVQADQGATEVDTMADLEALRGKMKDQR